MQLFFKVWVYPLAVLTSQQDVVWVISENVAATGEAFPGSFSWLYRLVCSDVLKIFVFLLSLKILMEICDSVQY
jgi:hypothetical protein